MNAHSNPEGREGREKRGAAMLDMYYRDAALATRKSMPLPTPSNGPLPPRDRTPVRPPAPRPEAVRISMYDVHITAGWRDELLRMSKADYQKMFLCWLLEGNDVTLRGQYPDHERLIVIRGSEGGTLKIRAMDPKVKLPQFQVLTSDELKMALLRDREQGLQKK